MPKLQRCRQTSPPMARSLICLLLQAAVPARVRATPTCARACVTMAGPARLARLMLALACLACWCCAPAGALPSLSSLWGSEKSAAAAAAAGGAAGAGSPRGNRKFGGSIVTTDANVRMRHRQRERARVAARAAACCSLSRQRCAACRLCACQLRRALRCAGRGRYPVSPVGTRCHQ